MEFASKSVAMDPAEVVARIAATRRERLLHVNRRRLRWEDLEDCYSQATLELVARARRRPFESPEHAANALEQKFTSRIEDRRRAIAGRSPIEAALASALPLEAPGGAIELEDRSAEIVRQVATRIEVRRLREVAGELTRDQRLVIASQLSTDLECREFCERFGWSTEKYRKVAQRARRRLRGLVIEYELGERCRRLEPDLLAWSAGVASSEQARRAESHVANCTTCARNIQGLDRAAREVAALLPLPVGASAGVLAKLGTVWLALRRALPFAGHTGAEAGAAGGSALGVGAAKLGVAAACLAGAAGGYAICTGLPGALGHHQPEHRRAAIRAATFAPSRGDPTSARSARGLVASSHRSQTARRSPSRRPLRGAAAAAQAHREFGGATAARAADARLAAPSRATTLSGSSGAGSQAKQEFSFER